MLQEEVQQYPPILICSFQVEGIPVSPYAVRKAIENTAASISDAPEEKLTTGHGLLQVDQLVPLIISCFAFFLKQYERLPLQFY
jgi:hypothetical protein